MSAKVAGGDATVSIRTEVNNHGKGAQNARVTSTIVDPSGKPVGKVATAPASAPEGGEQTYEQTMVVRRPLRWSLEERNLYKLVTEVSARGEMVDRHEAPFCIRRLEFDP